MIVMKYAASNQANATLDALKAVRDIVLGRFLSRASLGNLSASWNRLPENFRRGIPSAVRDSSCTHANKGANLRYRPLEKDRDSLERRAVVLIHTFFMLACDGEPSC